MDNTTQSKGHERIWIDPEMNVWTKGATERETEYMRADLAQSRAIEFADWILEHTETDCGEVKTFITGCNSFDTGRAYQIFLKEKG